MAGFARTIEAEQFDATQWGPYGWVPLPDTDARDGQSTLFFEWGDAHLNLIGHDADEEPHTGAGLGCEMLFRHRTHTQALLVLYCPAVVGVSASVVTLRLPADSGKPRPRTTL